MPAQTATARPTRSTGAAFGTPVQVADGFTLAEGPLWDPCTDTLLFTDVTASVVHTLSRRRRSRRVHGGHEQRERPGVRHRRLVDPGADGRQPGHIARRDKRARSSRSIPPDSMLHTPDDVIVRSDGTIYFTDGDFPPIGSVRSRARCRSTRSSPAPNELINVGTVAGPNGIELSPDETALYVDAYFAGTVTKFDVAADGTRSNAGRARERALHAGQSVPRRRRQPLRRRQHGAASASPRRHADRADPGRRDAGRHQLRLRRRRRQDLVHHGLDHAVEARRHADPGPRLAGQPQAREVLSPAPARSQPEYRSTLPE